MKQIIWKMLDGSIAYSRPAAPTLDGETEQEYLDRLAPIILKKTPALTGAVRIADADLSKEDWTFRDAWTGADGVKAKVDMAKAREIHRNRMRRARAPKLAALDVEQLRGRSVDAEKQALRDVTAAPEIDAAQTPDELKAVWPDVLR